MNLGCCICRKKYVNATFKSGHGKIVTCNHMPFYSSALGHLVKISPLTWDGRVAGGTGVSISLLKSHLYLSVTTRLSTAPRSIGNARNSLEKEFGAENSPLSTSKQEGRRKPSGNKEYTETVAFEGTNCVCWPSIDAPFF